MPYLSIKELMEAGVHFGHQTRRWNPKMKPYIYGARNGIYIIDLSKTQHLFERAYDHVRETVSRGGTIVFIGTKKQAQEIVETEAKRAGMPFIINRWLGGMLTNFKTIKQSIERLKKLETMKNDERLTKKERISIERQIVKLEKALGGIKEMKDVPATIFVVDTKKERIAISEAQRLGISVVAIVDTNCDPDGVNFVIPGNDDAIRAITLFTSKIADSVLEGKKIYDDKIRGGQPIEPLERVRGAGMGTYIDPQVYKESLEADVDEEDISGESEGSES